MYERDVWCDTSFNIMIIQFNMDKKLFAAASEGDLELVKNLLTQGADKEYKDDEVSQLKDNW